MAEQQCLSPSLIRELDKHNPDGKRRPDLRGDVIVAGLSEKGPAQALDFVLNARNKLRARDAAAREVEKKKHLSALDDIEQKIACLQAARGQKGRAKRSVITSNISKHELEQHIAEQQRTLNKLKRKEESLTNLQTYTDSYDGRWGMQSYNLDQLPTVFFIREIVSDVVDEVLRSRGIFARSLQAAILSRSSRPTNTTNSPFLFPWGDEDLHALELYEALVEEVLYDCFTEANHEIMRLDTIIHEVTVDPLLRSSLSLRTGNTSVSTCKFYVEETYMELKARYLSEANILQERNQTLFISEESQGVNDKFESRRAEEISQSKLNNYWSLHSSESSTISLGVEVTTSTFHKNGSIIFGTKTGNVILCRCSLKQNNWWIMFGEDRQASRRQKKTVSSLGDGQPVVHLSISVDGTQIVATDKSGTVSVWHIRATSRPNERMEPAEVVLFQKFKQRDLTFVSGPLADQDPKCIPVAAIFYPSFNLLGQQPFLAIGLSNGDILRFQIGNSDKLRVYPDAMQGRSEFQSHLANGKAAELLRPHKPSQMLTIALRGNLSLETLGADGTLSTWTHGLLSQNGFGWFSPTASVNIDFSLSELVEAMDLGAEVYNFETDEKSVMEQTDDIVGAVLDIVNINPADPPWVLEEKDGIVRSIFKVPSSDASNDVQEVMTLVLDSKTDRLLSGTLYPLLMVPRQSEQIICAFADDHDDVVSVMSMYPAGRTQGPVMSVFVFARETETKNDFQAQKLKCIFRRNVQIPEDTRQRILSSNKRSCHLIVTRVLKQVESSFIIFSILGRVFSYCIETGLEIKKLSQHFVNLMENDSVVSFVDEFQDQQLGLSFVDDKGTLLAKKFINDSLPSDVLKHETAVPQSLKRSTKER